MMRSMICGYEQMASNVGMIYLGAVQGQSLICFSEMFDLVL